MFLLSEKHLSDSFSATKTTLTNGDARDPRSKAKVSIPYINWISQNQICALAAQAAPTDPRKTVSDPTRKAPKKQEPAKPKSLEKRSPVETDKPDKKKKATKSPGKSAAAKTGKEMPKSPKSGPVKKQVPKKSSGKAPKRPSDENRADDVAKVPKKKDAVCMCLFLLLIFVECLQSTQTSVKDSKVKEKVPRRSPLPTQAPVRPPKRNTSTER